MVWSSIARSMLLSKPTLVRSTCVVSACVAAATLVRWLLGSVANTVPFVTYFPAIVLCALLAGWRAGVVSIFVSMAIVNFIFLRPRLSIWSDWQTAAMMALFVLSCGLLVAIAQSLRTTVRKLKAASERAEFLNQELLHRVRNTLTLVNSLAALTYQAEPDRFVRSFSSRMTALSRSLDVLSHRDDQQCDLREAVEQACQPFQHGDRICISGDNSILPGTVCAPLILAVHELCTNAVKYGALSVPGGRVTINLTADPAQAVARLVWHEQGGPAVAAPVHEGLGTVLLSHPALGPARRFFEPDGLRCEMRLETA